MEVSSWLNVQTFLALFVCFAGCYYYLSRRKKNLPPGPWRLPVIGNALWVFRKASSPDTLGTVMMQASEEYGNGLLYLTVFNKGLLFIHGYDAVKELFVTHADKFSDRPYWMQPEMKKDGNRGFIFESGENFKQLRKFVVQNLREFGVGKTSLEDMILVEAEAAASVIQEAAGQPYDVQDLVLFITFNVTFGIVFGKRFEYGDEKCTKLQETVRVMFQKKGIMDISSRLPNFLLKLIGRDKVKEWNARTEAISAIKQYMLDEITEHEDTFDEHNIRDFMDLYLQNKHTGQNTHLFNDDNVIRVILELFVGGSDTSANTLIWGIMYMIEYPDIQKRCQDELHEMCGNQTVHWSDRDKLPYVEATLMEVQRIAAVGEVTLFHTNLEETSVRGYTIPERTLIMGNIMSVCMDPRYWDNPTEFRPERFLEDGKIKKNVAFIPFGAGPRTCVGEVLARMEMFLVFTHLLQRFTFRREHDDVPISFKRDKSQIVGTPMPFKTRAIPRL